MLKFPVQICDALLLLNTRTNIYMGITLNQPGYTHPAVTGVQNYNDKIQLVFIRIHFETNGSNCNV